jgi:FMN-dependent NADH-azoreductase
MVLNVQLDSISPPLEGPAMTLLRIDASVQGPASASSALADLALAEFLAARPDETVVRRHLGAEPLPSDAWAAAVGAGFTPDDQRSPEQTAALALAATLAAELADADAAVLALPLYNFGVSQHVKTWIDLALAGAPHGTRLLDGTPTVLVTTRGGAYGPGTPREGWDHSTDYLRRILADVWVPTRRRRARVHPVGINPALDEFTELATLMKKQSRRPRPPPARPGPRVLNFW